MSILNFIPEVWVARMEYFRKQATVFGGIVSSEFNGKIIALNQTLTVRIPGQITISDYVKGADISLEEPTGFETEVTIDTGKQWGVGIDDVDAAVCDVNLLNEYTSDAGYRLAVLQDTYVLSKYAGAALTYGSTATPIDVTKANILATMGRIGRVMSDNKLPAENRWMVVPPWFIEKLVLAGLDLKTDNTELFNNGFVGKVLGINLRVSTNVQTVDTTKYKCLAGYGTRGIAFIQGLSKTKAVEEVKQFREGVIGMTYYGGKVFRPDELMCVTLTEGTEA